ncbi:MAG: carbohydrate-binding domain-containing protein, partial [Promethearchaeota archaeon]
LKADNADDAAEGYISVENGVITVTSGGDAIQAATDVMITDGKISLTSGGGSSGVIYASTSAKGIKANVSVTIDGGTFTIDSADDAVHSNDKITINGGSFAISTGDDGFHADTSLEVNGGTIDITESYEGMESAVITINDGDIHITSSDDGLNAAGGNDGSGMDPGPGRPGRDGFMESGDYYLYINGGYIVIDSGGDGMDINGGIEMTGGYVIINGPTSNMNGALDYYSSFKITGGFLVAVGSSGMAEAPGTSSTQYSFLLNFRSSISAGTLINLQTSDGTVIFSFKPTKAYQSIVFSSSTLTAGTTYDVYLGGSSTGTATDGLYLSGTYTPGTKYGSFILSSIVTRLY